MRINVFIIVLVIFLVACSSQNHQLVYTPIFEVSNEPIIEINKDQDYTFGYLTVPENRSDPNSRMIKLPVYVFKSRSKTPKPDPIIYTVGGPGATTMSSAPYLNYYRYLDDRDFILFEQRGVQYAKPHLDCPEWSRATFQANQPGFDEEKSDSIFTDAAMRCRERLSTLGIDLNGYRTTEIAADIADLRKALKIDQYHLLTISYSTKIAQVIMRDYPEGLRSVVMDSPLPLEVSYDEESVRNLYESVHRLLDDCASDETCNSAFPNLKSRFFKYLRQISENPIEVSVKNPRNEQMETFFVKGKDVISLFSSASTGDIPYVPLTIHKLLEGDLTPIQNLLSDLFEGPGAGNGIGMRLSVWCAEEFPFTDQSVIASETRRYPEMVGLSPAVFSAEVCKIWSVTSAPPVDDEPVNSDIPVSFINGEYDPVTPYKWGVQMKRHFPNSHHLIFKGWMHTPTTNWGNPCGMIVANEFFNDPTQMPQADCFSKILKPIFQTE